MCFDLLSYSFSFFPILNQVRTPSVVTALEGEEVSQVHVYNGCEHTLATTRDGKIFSFGYNYRGQVQYVYFVLIALHFLFFFFGFLVELSYCRVFVVWSVVKHILYVTIPSSPDS